MNCKNYDKIMRERIEKLDGKPAMYLHSCCAPCSTTCIEELYPYFSLTIVYYNPNIDEKEEYEKRAAEQIRYVREVYGDSINVIEEGWQKDDFEKIASGREHCPEGGERCAECYRLRLEKAASYCKERDYFATTLTVSPLKNAEKINQIGESIEKTCAGIYLPTDFKKREGYKKSAIISAKHGLYRQNYCGCRFSRKTKADEKNQK